jgi:beta-lactamase class A
MGYMATRRVVLAGAAAWLCARGVRGNQSRSGAAGVAQLAALEKRAGGLLGVAAVDTATGRRIDHRSSERFALCSTFKFLAAAAILQRVDQGRDRLNRMIAYGESDLLEYAPVSKEHVKEGGMALGDVCAAAVQWSDNTAANLLFKILDGPQGLTAFIRTLGDNITRLDHNEPALNVVAPGEEHDTTTPAAMVRLLSTVLFGQILSQESRARLEGWMLDAKVGEHRIAAGLPPGWKIAQKAGTWSNQTNDVGVVWPINRAPIVIAVYYARGEKALEERESVLRDVGQIVARALG